MAVVVLISSGSVVLGGGSERRKTERRRGEKRWRRRWGRELGLGERRGTRGGFKGGKGAVLAGGGGQEATARARVKAMSIASLRGRSWRRGKSDGSGWLGPGKRKERD